MTVYQKVDIAPDTPEWLEERRNSVGASEVAAVMGLSKWGTALDVYKSKKGIDKPFDPVLSFIGHKSETMIREWLLTLSGANVQLDTGFMARRPDFPFLHASFDDMTTDGIPVQYKTAHQNTAHVWDEGIPVVYQVQEQAEMFVAGADRALVVVLIGGREFRLFWVPRDDEFIEGHMLPALEAFWDGVVNDTPPAPSTVEEIQEVWPSQSKECELDVEGFDLLGRITLGRSDMKAIEDEVKQAQVLLAQQVQDADTLTFEGRVVGTWKSQKGRAGFDARAFAADHPQLHAEYVRIGQPFKVLRATKQKD